MINHLRYLRYVIKHKYFVFQAGMELHVPLWRLIIHDWTKFLPSEWFPYRRFFYGSIPSSKSGGPKRKATYEFECAWNLHQKRNDHHWQHWVRIGDDGTIVPLPMSPNAFREMIADWKGAGKAITGKDDTDEWYMKNRDQMLLHPNTRLWVEEWLHVEEKHPDILQYIQDLKDNKDVWYWNSESKPT